MVRLFNYLALFLAASTSINSLHLNKRLEPAVIGAIAGGGTALVGAAAAAGTAVYNARRREKHEKDLEAQKHTQNIELEKVKLDNKKKELKTQTEMAAKLERAKNRPGGQLSPFNSPTPSRSNSISSNKSQKPPVPPKPANLQAPKKSPPPVAAKPAHLKAPPVASGSKTKRAIRWLINALQ